jgi:hypothetical protein
MDIGILKEKIGGIEDPRWAWGNLQYNLEDIIIMEVRRYAAGKKKSCWVMERSFFL